MLTTFAESGSLLKKALTRTGILALLDQMGLRRPLARMRRWLVPSLRRQDRDLNRDYHTFKKTHGAVLRAANPPVYPSKTVLVASLNDWVAQVKLESVFTKALQYKGFHSVIATFSDKANAHRFHKLFGFRHLAFADRSITPSLRRWATAEAARFLDKKPRFRDVLEYERRGVQVGRHVLSSIVSTLRSGSVGFDDPRVAQMLGAGLTEALMLADAAERMIDQVRPDLVLFLERGYIPYSEFFDVALNRGIPAIQYCQCHRADAFILKRYRQDIRNQHPWSLSRQSWEQVRRMPWNAAMEEDLMRELRGRYEQGKWFNRKYLQVGKQMKTPDEIRRQLQLDPDKKTAVIFSHVLWDATFFYGTTLFDDYEHWLVETVKAACANPKVNWIVKLHPDYVWKMKKAGDTGLPPEFAALGNKVGELPSHVKILEPQTDISTYSLFQVTDWCLTVRGTVGIEMPCFGIPVITAGTGRYAGLGITIDSRSREEYLERLADLQDVPALNAEQIERARRHAFGLLRLRPCPFTSFELVQDKLDALGHPLDHNLTLRTQVPEDFYKAADLAQFARWASDEDTDDFLCRLDAKQTIRRQAG